MQPLSTTPTSHKPQHTSAAQSGAMFYSVNVPDGELKSSYNETLNEGEKVDQPK